jgi:hypothetical protein
VSGSLIDERCTSRLISSRSDSLSATFSTRTGKAGGKSTAGTAKKKKGVDKGAYATEVRGISDRTHVDMLVTDIVICLGSQEDAAFKTKQKADQKALKEAKAKLQGKKKK